MACEEYFDTYIKGIQVFTCKHSKPLSKQTVIEFTCFVCLNASVDKQSSGKTQ